MAALSTLGNIGGICFLIVGGLLTVIFVMSYLALRKWKSENSYG